MAWAPATFVKKSDASKASSSDSNLKASSDWPLLSNIQSQSSIRCLASDAFSITIHQWLDGWVAGRKGYKSRSRKRTPPTTQKPKIWDFITKLGVVGDDETGIEYRQPNKSFPFQLYCQMHNSYLR